MDIPNIIKKIANSEEITTEEREALKSFDFARPTNDAIASARRKAEAERDKALTRISELEEEIKDLQATNNSVVDAKDTDIAKLQRNLDKLQKSFESMQNEAKRVKEEKAQLIREKAIIDFAKSNGIKPPKGVAEKGLFELFKQAVGNTDIEDTDAMQAVLESFRSDYSGYIGVDGVNIPSVGQANMNNGVDNPFAKDSFNLTKQAELYASNPQLAKELATQVGLNI